MARLKDALQWIAENDNTGEQDTAEEIGNYVSTCLVADVWGKDQYMLGLKIWKIREEARKATSGEHCPDAATQTGMYDHC